MIVDMNEQCFIIDADCKIAVVDELMNRKHCIIGLIMTSVIQIDKHKAMLTSTTVSETLSRCEKQVHFETLERHVP